MFFIIPSSFALNQTDDGSDDIVTSDQSDVLSAANKNYYFNSSAENDGDGSQSKPYKYLTTDKIVENSIIHLADGEYQINGNKSINTVSFIGQSSQNTIVKFQYDSSAFTFWSNVKLINLTLIDMPIWNYGTLNATNVVFKDSVGYLKNTGATNRINSATNSFGGAIYCPEYQYSVANVYINNCTFINNTAEYGGAIYMYGGNLDIKNSIFLNNYAYNYGGAIGCEYNSKVNIDKSKFINSKSLNDAGGAIYIKDSKLTADTITILDSQATFGGAITSLSSTFTVNRLNATNNSAKYDGGAIFQFYGSFTLRNSNFINNSASNGGAMFIDNTTSTILYQNVFKNNTASNYAGAIYSILNTKIRDNFNEYYGNKANVENDFYDTSSVSLVIGSGNYTMYKSDSNFSGALPSNYSSLANGYVTSVKDQQAGGNCWAFAGLGVLEANILRASGDNLDLSEENMKNLIELYSDYGWYMETNNGGYDSMILAYLLSWMGPVLEEDDLYDDYSALSPLLNSVMHVQNVKFFKRSSYTDNDEIKQAIIKYGAVGTGIYFDSTYFNKETNSYYQSITTGSNHAVTIVGWDDDYSRTNFINRPSENGAWLVKNSWNTDWGNEGYFYVSYYDTSFIHIGDSEGAYTFILNDTIKYDKNYQYDIPGKTDYFISGNKNIWYQNIFESTGDEFLAAVSTYFEKECAWDLYVYLNDELKIVKNGTSECGYYTIDLGDYIHLKTGDKFKVIFKITSNGASFPVSEKIKSNKILYKEGISFFSTDGKKWTDLYDYVTSYSGHSYYSQVACIKAFTFIDEIASDITLNVSNKGYNPVEIVANVINQYGNPVSGGNVTFTINGAEYVANVKNGIANLTVELEEMAVSNIEAKYNNAGYLTSTANTTTTVNKKSAKLVLDIVQHAITTTITVNISKVINETILITLNDDLRYTVDSVNGIATLVLENIEAGNYTVKASILNDTYVNTEAYKDFNIDVKPTKIVATDFTAYYNGGNIYTVTLTDLYGSPVSNREVIFLINQRSFKKVTDANGTASIVITLTNGEYNLDILFNGDEKYINSSANVTVTVKSTIIPNEIRNYTLNSIYSIILLDKEGNKLNNTNVSLNVDGKAYDLITDENGTVLFNVDFDIGMHALSLVNPLNGEKFEDVINVYPRITENKGFTMYFGSGASYKVRISDDRGNYVGAGENVTFTINGKKYTRQTDSNGYAAFKITLAANTYTITAEYKGFKVSNKITVKPVLTAKDVTKKQAKTIKFTAKLVNKNGKALKNKYVTFKFKGKIYKAKTNSKGIATLSLKNLKVGKSVIYSIYGNSKIKNTITIKK